MTHLAGIAICGAVTGFAGATPTAVPGVLGYYIRLQNLAEKSCVVCSFLLIFQPAE